MLVVFKDLKQLNRRSEHVFLGIHSLERLRSWNLVPIEANKLNNELIIINYDLLVSASLNEIQVTNPSLIYSLPNGNENDEYPVLFIAQHNYFPMYVENQLMSIDYFSRLIEKGDGISSNSTRLITLHSLREILKNLDSIQIERDCWSQMSVDLNTYLHTLIKAHPYLGYMSVKERKEFRKISTADVSFAWGFYFKYFIEEWDVIRSEVVIPDISKKFEYNDWIGNFFDRDNPLWGLYLGPRKKFKFSESINESIYLIWKGWIKGT